MSRIKRHSTKKYYFKSILKHFESNQSMKLFLRYLILITSCLLNYIYSIKSKLLLVKSGIEKKINKFQFSIQSKAFSIY